MRTSSDNNKEEEPSMLPLGLLTLYALGSVADSLPLTATTTWLNNDLHMRQETQTIFYAAMFVPYSLKPSYGLLSEMIRSRRLLYIVATTGEALLYVVSAYCVHSIPLAFITVVAREAFAACAEMMLSAALADVITDSPITPENAQAQAGGARWFGTIIGYLIQLRLYSCTSHAVPARPVIASTALVLLPTAFLGFFTLPRTLKSIQNARRRSHVYTNARLLLGSALIALQALCVWIALKYVVASSRRQLWRAGLWIFVALLILSIGLCLWQCANEAYRPRSALNQTLLVSDKASTSATRATKRLITTAVIPALLVFALNAAPTAGVQISNLEFYLFFEARPCYLPYIELIMAASSLVACIIYAQCGKYLARSRLLLFFLFTAAAAVPLAFWPLAKAKPIGTSQKFCLGALCTSRFGYDAIVRVLNSFISEFALTAQTAITLRTAFALSDHSVNAATYGALLALVDSGASVSGWLAAPLVTRANIAYDNFSRLPWLLRVCALAQFLTITPLFALSTPTRHEPQSPQDNTKLLSVAFISNEEEEQEHLDSTVGFLPSGSGEDRRDISSSYAASSFGVDAVDDVGHNFFVAEETQTQNPIVITTVEQQQSESNI